MLKTILVVDDEFDIRELIGELLQDEGYRCVHAGGVREALDIMSGLERSNHQLDLVISDMNMLGGSGVDLLISLREKNNLVPFLFLSGESIDNEIAPFLGQGTVSCVLKPFKSVEFIEKVKQILN